MDAGDLKIGDTVKTKNGTEKLTKKEKKPGRHTVYNLEVHQSHTYYVSNIGVLAHNSKADISTSRGHQVGSIINTDGSTTASAIKEKSESVGFTPSQIGN